jgi:hypothetical protein
VTLDHGNPTVVVKTQGAERILSVDSGSSCSFFTDEGGGGNNRKYNNEPFGVTENSLDIVGEQQVPFLVGRVTFNHSFWFVNCRHFADGINTA